LLREDDSWRLDRVLDLLQLMLIHEATPRPIELTPDQALGSRWLQSWAPTSVRIIMSLKAGGIKSFLSQRPSSAYPSASSPPPQSASLPLLPDGRIDTISIQDYSFLNQGDSSAGGLVGGECGDGGRYEVGCPCLTVLNPAFLKQGECFLWRQADTPGLAAKWDVVASRLLHLPRG